MNVIVGENGTGKTHLLKAIYSVLASSSEENRRLLSPTKTLMQTRVADKLFNVFRPEALGRLASRRQGQVRCDMSFEFVQPEHNISFSFRTSSRTEVAISTTPTRWLDSQPAYIPTRDLMTIFPNFVSIYEAHYLDLEETWRDTCVLLGSPLQRGPRETRIKELIAPLEHAMGGEITLDRNGRFYLQTATGRLEMPLVAEGIRKLGMVARLIATGTLLERGYLLWDEPEAGLNPKLVRALARTIIELGRAGVQVFIATHSLFLLREMEIVLTEIKDSELRPRFFGLHTSEEGVTISSGRDVSAIGEITSLNEEIEQSDRFIEVSSKQ